MFDLILLASAMAIAALPKAEAPPATVSEPQAIEDPPRFEFRVQHLQMSATVQFDEQGKPRHNPGNLMMNILVTYSGDVFPSSYRDFKVDRITTSAGEALQVNATHRRTQMINNAMARQARPTQFHLSLSTPMPKWSAARLSEIAGSVQIDCGTGPVQQIVLGTIKQIEGQRIALDGLPDCDLTLRRQGDSQIVIDASAAAARQLRGVTFLDAEGKPLQCNGWGQHGDTPRWTFHVKAGDDATVQIEIHPHSRTLDVPFLIRDVELPRLPGGGRIG